MKSIIVIGHKNPDTDSIVAAFVFADLLGKIKRPILGFFDFRAKPARTGSLNNETKFVFDYFKQEPPSLIENIKNKDVILVDHGEYSQAADGVEEANIIGVLDHHNIGGLKTAAPIFYHAEPIGSTSTILAKMFLENNLSFSKKTAGLLLSAILSDTLKFISPTTTDEDRKIAQILSKVSGENINSLSEKMFEAKSDIKSISPDELVNSDYKEFESNGTNFGIGVWETTCPDKVKKMKEEIFTALEKLKEKRKIKLMFFVLINIFKRNSELFLLGEKEKSIAEKVFKKKAKDNLLFLPGVVSRKKEIAPLLITFLEKNEVVCQ